MKVELDILKLDVADIVTTSGEEECYCDIEGLIMD